MPQLSESQQRRARAILAKGNVTAVPGQRGPETETRSYEAKESTIYYTGPTGQKSVQYRDPATGETYTDYTKPIGPAASGLPDYVPGIAYGYRNLPEHGKERLGGYYLVTPKAGPNAGQSFILPHSDLGPGAGKGEKLDYNAPATKMVYGSLKAPQGGSYLQYLGKNLPEDVGIGPVAYPPEALREKYGLSESHAGFIKDQALRRSTIEEAQVAVKPPQAREGQQDLIPGGGAAVPYLGMQQELDRARTSGRELDSATPTVNGNGKLSVDVDAPRGVAVKAEGEGLFNKTETTRQLEPMAAE